MRKMVKAKPKEIEIDFEQRVLPGLKYCQRVGNIMGSVLLSLLSTIDQGQFDSPKRIGCFPTDQAVVPNFTVVLSLPKERKA